MARGATIFPRNSYPLFVCLVPEFSAFHFSCVRKWFVSVWKKGTLLTFESQCIILVSALQCRPVSCASELHHFTDHSIMQCIVARRCISTSCRKLYGLSNWTEVRQSKAIRAESSRVKPLITHTYNFHSHFECTEYSIWLCLRRTSGQLAWKLACVYCIHAIWNEATPHMKVQQQQRNVQWKQRGERR